jgi:ATP-binding protein involved in chromosome partitioning
MRIAVPLSGGKFNAHFGQSTAFWVCDVEEGSQAVANGRELPLPGEGGCGVIPAVLSRAGVNLVIAGGMGAGAQANLARCGIEAIAGATGGTPQEIVQDYLAGRLVSTGQLCQQHEGHGHQHRHGHGQGGGCHGHGKD